MPAWWMRGRPGAGVRARPFRFGVQSYSAASGADWRAQASAAESLGYSALHLADHIIGPGPALSATNHPVQNLSPVPAMAVAAEATTTLKVGCRVFCTDYRNPVMLAKDLATLDMFSEGRLEAGLGAGWLQGEYEAVGIGFDRAGVRIDRFEETLAVIRACFGSGEVDVRGQYVHAVGFEGVPKPADRPGGALPPLMIGGGSRRMLGVAGREADIVSLNFDNSSGRIGPLGVASSTAELTAAKIGWIRDGAGDRFDDIEIEIGAYFTVITDDRAKTLDKMGSMLGLSAEQFGQHPHALVGSVEAVCEQIIERREAYGISYITVGRPVMEAFAPVVERLAGQ
jgi:probable F420-dependent oxidoreductase